MIAGQQSRGLHDLPRLAVSALRHIDLHPRLLYRMGPVGREAFDCPNLRACGFVHRSHARTDGLAILVNRARSTERHTAPVLRTGESEDVSQVPQQWHLRITVKGAFHSIHFELEHEPPL